MYAWYKISSVSECPFLKPGDQIMHEQFTKSAQDVMTLTNQGAKDLQHQYIGTEHLLWALCTELTCTGADIIAHLEVLPETVLADVLPYLAPQPDPITFDKLPFTPRAKRVLEFAEQESRAFGRKLVDTEDLLAGLLLEGEGIAAQILYTRGITIQKARKAICEMRNIPMPEVFRQQQEENADASCVSFKIVTPALQRELDLLKTTLQQLSDVIPLDPHISDAELVQMARNAIEIHEAFRNITR